VRVILESTWLGHSGRGQRFSAPSCAALERSIRGALQAANVVPRDIDYVECAAAGASLADVAEIEALEAVFGSDGERKLPIGTLKSNIGHLEAAAGMSQLMKVLLQLKASRFAPTLAAQVQHPLLHWSALHVQPVERCSEWQERADGTPRRALINAVGATGSYAHAVLREPARGPGRANGAKKQHFVLLSAASRAQLVVQAERLRQFVLEEPTVHLEDIAFTTQVGRVSLAHRLVIECRELDELAAGLAAFAKEQEFAGLRVSEVDPDAAQQFAPSSQSRAAECWLGGGKIDWAPLTGETARRIGLPTLAFAREHHWLPGADVDVQAGNGPQMEQYLLDVYAEISEIPRSRLRARTPLERYGLSSSIIGQLNQRLTRDLGEIPRTLFFEYPDLAGVAAFLAERFNVPGATPQQERSSPGASAVAEARSPCSAVPHASDAAEVDGRVAIIGLGGRYPGSSDLDSFCRTLLDGRDQIRQMPEERCAPDWPRELMWGSFLDHVDAFDPLFFQITPRDAELMCPEERLFLQVAWETMEDGGYGRQRLQKEHKSRCGVFVGAMYNEYPFFGVERTLRGQRGYAGSAVAGIANRVSYFLDLRGPSMTVDTMCSASLTCLHLAVESLRRNECELALAGGVNLSLHANKFVQIEGMKMASSDHRCRAFGAGGDGFAPGEGVGAVLLKPLKRALADGDRIQAVVLGSAVNHGGRTNGYTVPNPAAQAEVVQEALKRAGVRPTTIGYIEAHGTGTELGDPIEIEGLKRAYTSNAEHVAAGAIAIGSLKSVLGHLEAAAGIAGVTKVVQQMRHGRFAPSLHADVLNPNVDWARSPFRVQREAADWPQLRDAAGSLLPRRAAVSAFGAGGSNAHVVLEQLVLAPPERRTRPGARELIVLSARTPASLRAMAERLSAFVCRAEADTALEDIAFTLQVGRDAFRERLAIVAATRAELVEALARFAEGRGGVLDGRASDEPPVGSPPSEPEALARFWIAGGEVNWRALRGPTTARVIGLPTYPFAEMRCWLSEASTEPAPAVTLYEKAWCAAEQPPSSSMGIDGPVACVYGSGSEAIARAVARALGEDKVLLVREGSAWGPSHADATTWLDLGDLCAQSPKHEAWLTRLGWLQSWVARRAAGQRRLLHVTSGLYAPRSGGSVVGARMAAVVRSLSSEVHELSARTLDTDLPSERVTAIVDQILAELAIPEGASEVFYERGRRQVPELRQLLRPAREVRQLAPDKVYLVTGGTRGLGAKVAEHLVERGARRLALVCQGPFPSRREAWDDPAMPAAAQAAVKTVRELERRGASVALHARSLSDRPALDEFVRRVRRELGPIGGIVHCAGRASHGSPAFVRKTLDEIAATFEPKVDGLEALVDVCGRDEPEFFLLFSSVSAIAPTLAAGVLDYAAANAFMEIFAAHQSASRAGGLCSVAWPPWSESSVSDAARAACASVGLGCLETASALCALDTLIAQPAPARLLVLPPVAPGFDANSLLRAPPRARPAPLPAPPTVEKGRLDWLVELFSTELAIPVNELDQTAHFSDLGIESVMLAALVEKIEQRVSRPLDPSVLLEHPTLERLALHLASFAPRGASSSTSHDAHPRLDARSEATFRRPELPTGAIAVLGASARFPGARDEAGFWSNLLAGHCAVSEVPKTRWDTAQLYSPRHELGRSMSKWGGFVEGLEDFDPEYFRMTEDEARRCDPAIRLVMEGAVTGLGDAGYRLEDVRGSQTGVFVGARMSGYRRRAPVQQFAPMGGDQNFIGAHLAHFLDIHGPNLVVDSACSSALVAVKLACQALLAGEADLAIAGAVEVLLDEEPYLEFSAARALSPSGRCKTFDQHADGFVPGEGCGMVILKALPQAIRDGDRIRAVIRGIAVNNDGATMGLTTPNPAAQMDVVLRALRASGLDAASVQMLEAHGTATMIGDPIELRALTDAFRTATSRAGFCAIGSVKSNIGHLLSAAGIAGLIKAILAIEHGLIPPTLFCTTPNPRFDFEASPFFPNTRVRPWHADPGERIAGVSSFGLGGTNAHAILSGLASEVSAQRSVARSALPPPTWARRRCWLERPDSAPRAAPPRPAAPAFSARPPAPEASILNLEFIS
jgi:acyl transferase domain-containing protein/acyl carrier protein